MSTYIIYDKIEQRFPFRYLTVKRFVGRFAPPYKTTTLSSGYLEFAIADLAEGSTRGLVNAFSNVKRALHLEVDCLLQQYGLFLHYGHGNFPSKLQILDELGLLPITILSNLNVERNLIEHEYDVPARKRVQEAIDVLKLLLFTTEKLMEATPQEVVLGWRNPNRHVLLQLEPFEGELRLFTLAAKNKYQKIAGVNCISQLRAFPNNGIIPNGELESGIKMSRRPWKVIKLNKAQAVEWKPILKESINVQLKNSALNVHAPPHGYVTVTIPFNIDSKEPLSQTLDERIKENFKSKHP
jgi:hypothetical protein